MKTLSTTLSFENAGHTLISQVGTYCVVVASILSSRFLDLYRAGVAHSFLLEWHYLIFASIVSLVAFPVVYDRVKFDQSQPVLVRLSLIFSAGMGWEKILATALKG
jgi:hypothetical protein